MAATRPWLAVHPASQQDSVAATALRASLAAFKGKLAGTAARGPFDGVMEQVAAPTNVTFVGAATCSMTPSNGPRAAVPASLPLKAARLARRAVAATESCW